MTTSEFMTRKYRLKLAKLMERTTANNYTQHKEDLMRKWTAQVEFWSKYNKQG